MHVFDRWPELAFLFICTKETGRNIRKSFEYIWIVSVNVFQGVRGLHTNLLWGDMSQFTSSLCFNWVVPTTRKTSVHWITWWIVEIVWNLDTQIFQSVLLFRHSGGYKIYEGGVCLTYNMISIYSSKRWFVRCWRSLLIRGLCISPFRFCFRMKYDPFHLHTLL